MPLDTFSAHRTGELLRLRSSGLFASTQALKQVRETYDIVPEEQRVAAELFPYTDLASGWCHSEQGEVFSCDALN